MILMLKLNKGYNSILVQVGESEADRANFLLRFTDDLLGAFFYLN